MWCNYGELKTNVAVTNQGEKKLIVLLAVIILSETDILLCLLKVSRHKLYNLGSLHYVWGFLAAPNLDQ